MEHADLPEPCDETKNHYDDRIPSSQLEAVPGENVAIFYGLEVLQPNEYTVNERGELQGVESQGEEVKKSQKEKDKKKKESSDVVADGATAAKKKRKAESEEPAPEEPTAPTTTDEAKDDPVKESQKSKKKKKKRKKTADKAPESSKGQQQAIDDAARVDATNDDSSVERMQTSWMVATGGVELHPQLCQSLLQQNFWTPTPIQSATLPAAILGRRNVVGAAPTGSGKTLAYLMPIFQALLQRDDDDNNRSLQALILTPTRELASQVSRECEKLSPRKCGIIVGGLAHAKQQRILNKNRPPVIVATPGRLWQLVSHEYVLFVL